MALRNRYGYKCQKTTFTVISRLTPLGYMHVVPGETVSGNVSFRNMSAPTVRNMLTRTYADYYAFYCPYRLIDASWPDFISGVTDVHPAGVAGRFTTNFEPRVTKSTLGVGNPADENTPWKRGCYNLVYRDYFAKNKSEITDVLQLTTHAVFQRPSTFEVAEPVKPDAGTTVDTSGATLAVDDIRKAFAEDQFAKMRQFYGQRYTDYLLAMGVKTPWTLLDEPESIGQLHTDLPYRMINNTSPDDPAGPDIQNLGFNAGYFSGRGTLRMKRTFIPEHGIIGWYGCVRVDPLVPESPTSPEDSFSTREEYFSPEFESEKIQKYSNQLLESDNVNFELDLERPKYDQHRKGLNENVLIDLSATRSEIMGMAFDGDVKDKYEVNDFNDEFQQGTLPTTNQFQVTGQWNVIRNSPIMKHGQMRPLY